jgi:FlaA1/EpsC-like NDP-sugar epimerase
MINKRNELASSDIFSHIPDSTYLPRWGVLLIDIVLISVAYWTSLWLGEGAFSYRFQPGGVLPAWQQYLILLSVQIGCFWLFHTYSGILRYSTFIDTIKSFIAVFGCGMILILFNLTYHRFTSRQLLLNTVIGIYMPIAFVFLFCLRVGVKTLYEMIYQQSAGSKRVMIYGTKAAGIAIAKMLRSSDNTPFRPAGFIDSSDKPERHDIMGMPVFRLSDKLFIWMKTHNVHDIIISPTKMREIKPDRDLQIFIDHGIRILTTPQVTELESEDSSGKQNIGRIESIKIEDLLERPTININTDNVDKILRDKVVLISGAAGSIGSEIVRQVQKFRPKATILIELAESPLHDLTLDLRHLFPDARFIPVIADIRNKERLEQIFSEFRPDIVYHAAAYKHVPLMEDYPNEAIMANVLGTKNMADTAVKYHVERFLMISTDKAVNPTNIMGASKRIAEIYVQSLFNKLHHSDPSCTKFITTRFGNVLGSNGSVIPYFKKQIAAKGPVTVTHPDIIRYFMTIPEACCLVLEASTLGEGGEIFVFDMGRPVKILDLAKNMIRLAGYIPGKDIPIVFTGLRPGEKLYEELLNQKETTIPTQNEKIMVARVREEDYDQVSLLIDQLISLAHANKPFLTVQLMKQIVPEYISNNSIYEQLDQ